MSLNLQNLFQVFILGTHVHQIAQHQHFKLYCYIASSFTLSTMSFTTPPSSNTSNSKTSITNLHALSM